MLKKQRVPAQNLEDYVGTHEEKIKVGTRDKAKGLEFEAVLLPDGRSTLTSGVSSSDSSAKSEREELERRRLFVACTRARDYLWVGGVGR